MREEKNMEEGGKVRQGKEGGKERESREGERRQAGRGREQGVRYLLTLSRLKGLLAPVCAPSLGHPN